MRISAAAARLSLLVLVALCIPAASARAQAAAPPPPPPPPPLTEGSAEFAFVGTTGNASTQTIGIGGDYIYRPSPWETRLKVRYVRNEADDEVKAQSFLFSGRVQRALRDGLSGFGQYDYQRDRFAGILNRNTVEGGVVYSAIDRAPQKLTVDASLGYANEKRLIGPDLSAGMFGTGAIYALKISDTSQLDEDGHFVFSLADSSDWRYANTVSVTAKLTTLLSLKVSNALRYVNEHVLGFKKTDLVTS